LRDPKGHFERRPPCMISRQNGVAADDIARAIVSYSFSL
jgi:hypothetical protein